MVINVQKWDLFVALSQHKENRLQQIRRAKNHKPPLHPENLDQFVARKVFGLKIAALPGGRERLVADKKVQINRKCDASADLKEIVDANGSGEVEWTAIFHRNFTETNDGEVKSEEKDEKARRTHHAPWLDEIH